MRILGTSKNKAAPRSHRRHAYDSDDGSLPFNKQHVVSDDEDCEQDNHFSSFFSDSSPFMTKRFPVNSSKGDENNSSAINFSSSSFHSGSFKVGDTHIGNTQFSAVEQAPRSAFEVRNVFDKSDNVKGSRSDSFEYFDTIPNSGRNAFRTTQHHSLSDPYAFPPITPPPGWSEENYTSWNGFFDNADSIHIVPQDGNGTFPEMTIWDSNDFVPRTLSTDASDENVPVDVDTVQKWKPTGLLSSTHDVQSQGSVHFDSENSTRLATRSPSVSSPTEKEEELMDRSKATSNSKLTLGLLAQISGLIDYQDEDAQYYEGTDIHAYMEPDIDENEVEKAVHARHDDDVLSDHEDPKEHESAASSFTFNTSEYGASYDGSLVDGSKDVPPKNAEDKENSYDMITDDCSWSDILDETSFNSDVPERLIQQILNKRQKQNSTEGVTTSLGKTTDSHGFDSSEEPKLKENNGLVVVDDEMKNQENRLSETNIAEHSKLTSDETRGVRGVAPGGRITSSTPFFWRSFPREGGEATESGPRSHDIALRNPALTDQTNNVKVTSSPLLMSKSQISNTLKMKNSIRSTQEGDPSSCHVHAANVQDEDCHSNKLAKTKAIAKGQVHVPTSSSAKRGSEHCSDEVCEYSSSAGIHAVTNRKGISEKNNSQSSHVHQALSSTTHSFHFDSVGSNKSSPRGENLKNVDDVGISLKGTSRKLSISRQGSPVNTRTINIPGKSISTVEGKNGEVTDTTSSSKHFLPATVSHRIEDSIKMLGQNHSHQQKKCDQFSKPRESSPVQRHFQTISASPTIVGQKCMKAEAIDTTNAIVVIPSTDSAQLSIVSSRPQLNKSTKNISSNESTSKLKSIQFAKPRQSSPSRGSMITSSESTLNCGENNITADKANEAVHLTHPFGPQTTERVNSIDTKMPSNKLRRSSPLARYIQNTSGSHIWEDQDTTNGALKVTSVGLLSQPCRSSIASSEVNEAIELASTDCLQSNSKSDKVTKPRHFSPMKSTGENQIKRNGISKSTDGAITQSCRSSTIISDINETTKNILKSNNTSDTLSKPRRTSPLARYMQTVSGKSIGDDQGKGVGTSKVVDTVSVSQAVTSGTLKSNVTCDPLSNPHQSSPVARNIQTVSGKPIWANQDKNGGHSQSTIVGCSQSLRPPNASSRANQIAECVNPVGVESNGLRGPLIQPRRPSATGGLLHTVSGNTICDDKGSRNNGSITANKFPSSQPPPAATVSSQVNTFTKDVSSGGGKSNATSDPLSKPRRSSPLARHMQAMSDPNWEGKECGNTSSMASSQSLRTSTSSSKVSEINLSVSSIEQKCNTVSSQATKPRRSSPVAIRMQTISRSPIWEGKRENVDCTAADATVVSQPLRHPTVSPQVSEVTKAISAGVVKSDEFNDAQSKPRQSSPNAKRIQPMSEVRFWDGQERRNADSKGSDSVLSSQPFPPSTVSSQPQFSPNTTIAHDNANTKTKLVHSFLSQPNPPSGGVRSFIASTAKLSSEKPHSINGDTCKEKGHESDQAVQQTMRPSPKVSTFKRENNETFKTSSADFCALNGGNNADKARTEEFNSRDNKASRNMTINSVPSSHFGRPSAAVPSQVTGMNIFQPNSVLSSEWKMSLESQINASADGCGHNVNGSKSNESLRPSFAAQLSSKERYSGVCNDKPIPGRQDTISVSKGVEVGSNFKSHNHFNAQDIGAVTSSHDSRQLSMTGDSFGTHKKSSAIKTEGYHSPLSQSNVVKTTKPMASPEQKIVKNTASSQTHNLSQSVIMRDDKFSAVHGQLSTDMFERQNTASSKSGTKVSVSARIAVFNKGKSIQK